MLRKLHRTAGLKSCCGALRVGAGFVLATVLVSQPALASVLTKDGKYLVSGEATLDMNGFNGTTSGVLADLGSGPLPTGTLNYSLDPSKMSMTEFNFDTGTATFTFNLLLTFPLQGLIGAPAVPIQLVETGALPAFNLFMGAGSSSFTTTNVGTISQPLLPPQSTSGSAIGAWSIDSTANGTFVFDTGSLTGGGIVMSGPFAGFSYFNGETYSATASASVNFPGGSASFSVTASNAPEPSSLLLLVSGLPLIALPRMNRAARRKQVSPQGDKISV